MVTGHETNKVLLFVQITRKADYVFNTDATVVIEICFIWNRMSYLYVTSLSNTCVFDDNTARQVTALCKWVREGEASYSLPEVDDSIVNAPLANDSIAGQVNMQWRGGGGAKIY